MGVLVGILIGLSRLAADSEITAMRASGLGVWTFLRVISIFVVVAWLLALGNSVYLAPRSLAALGQLQDHLKSSQVSFEVQPRVFYEGFPKISPLRAGRQGHVRRRTMERRIPRRFERSSRRRASAWRAKDCWSARGPTLWICISPMVPPTKPILRILTSIRFQPFRRRTFRSRFRPRKTIRNTNRHRSERSKLPTYCAPRKLPTRSRAAGT